jgi:hypothetical protein
VNGCYQDFRSVASFGFGGRESASKPPQSICKPLEQIPNRLRKSIVFGLTQKWKYEVKMSKIRKWCLFGLISLSGCLSLETDCCDYVNSYVLSDGLYVEKYRTFCAGVFGEVISSYLTDSTNFRLRIGSADEHGRLIVRKNGNTISTYVVESKLLSDTLEIKTINDLAIKSHRYDSTCTNAVPIFGTDMIKCNNCYPFSSYECEPGYYIATDQFKCKKDYLNAVYLTDSADFRILLGFYVPGRGPHFTAKLTSNNLLKVYKTESRWEYDTLNVQSFELNELLKGELKPVCKKK